MNEVVLFKSPENSGDYKLLFETNGYTPIFISVLDFVFINIEKLYSKLENHDRYSGLVITSSRAVEALVRCLEFGSKSIFHPWESKPVYVVGEATNSKIFTDLNLNGCGYSSGNANSLADYIIKENEKENIQRPLLFPCGNLKSEVLPEKLLNESISLDQLDVYNTQQNLCLKESLVQLHERDGIPSTLIFFSPSGVNFVIPILKTIGYDFGTSKLVSIGPSTEKKIKEWELTPFGTAQEPTVSSIILALKSGKKSV